MTWACWLRSNFRGEEFQQAQAKKEVDLDVLVIFGLRQRALEKLGQQFAKRDGVRPARRARLHARGLGGIGVLPDEIEEIIAGGLNKLGAEENVVVNIVHADGQRPHRQRDVIALQADSRWLGRAKYGEFVGHFLQPRALPKLAVRRRPSKEPKGQA